MTISSVQSNIDFYFYIGSYVISFILGGATTGITLFKKYYKKTKNTTIELGYLRIHGKLDEMLSELRIKTKSSRCGIVKFHNGGHFFDGDSILKFSTTHESCSLGTHSSLDAPQGQLTTRYVDKLELLEKNIATIYYTSYLKDSHFKVFLDLKNTVAFSCLPLFANGNIKIGYLICEWCDFDDIEKTQESDITQKMLYYRRIINLLLTSAINE